MKILLVEDKVGSSIAKLLEKWGYAVVLVQTAEDAWAELQQESIDFFLVDWMLPGATGVDLVQKIRSLAPYKNTPIVMISGRSKKEDIVEAGQKGIDSYIVKPFTALQLKEKIVQVNAEVEARLQRGDRSQRIIRGHQAFHPTDNGPLVVFGEKTNTMDGLRQTASQALIDYLDNAVTAIDAINGEYPALDLGYTIITSTNDLVQMLNKYSLRQRIRLLVISTECKGNSLSMARMRGRNEQTDIPFVLVCDAAGDIPADFMAAFEENGLPVRERAALDNPSWQALLKEHVLGSEAEALEG